MLHRLPSPPELLFAYRITLVLGAGIAFLGALPMTTMRGAPEVRRPWAFDLVDRGSLRLLSPIAVEVRFRPPVRRCHQFGLDVLSFMLLTVIAVPA